MKKFLLGLGIGLLISMPIFTFAATNLASKLSGRILLQVENNGEAWYVNPVNQQRYFLGRPEDAIKVMRELGLGISNNDLSQIQIAKNSITPITKNSQINDVTLTNYKIDVLTNIRDLENIIVNAAYSTPEQFCPSVIKNKTSRDNAYYMYIDAVNSLKNQYEKYRNDIEYIDNNLSSLEGVTQIVKDDCAKNNYIIN